MHDDDWHGQRAQRIEQSARIEVLRHHLKCAIILFDDILRQLAVFRLGTLEAALKQSLAVEAPNFAVKRIIGRRGQGGKIEQLQFGFQFDRAQQRGLIPALDWGGGKGRSDRQGVFRLGSFFHRFLVCGLHLLHL